MQVARRDQDDYRHYLDEQILEKKQRKMTERQRDLDDDQKMDE